MLACISYHSITNIWGTDCPVIAWFLRLQQTWRNPFIALKSQSDPRATSHNKELNAFHRSLRLHAKQWNLHTAVKRRSVEETPATVILSREYFRSARLWETKNVAAVTCTLFRIKFTTRPQGSTEFHRTRSSLSPPVSGGTNGPFMAVRTVNSAAAVCSLVS